MNTKFSQRLWIDLLPGDLVIESWGTVCLMLESPHKMKSNDTFAYEHYEWYALHSSGIVNLDGGVTDEWLIEDDAVVVRHDGNKW